VGIASFFNSLFSPCSPLRIQLSCPLSCTYIFWNFLDSAPNCLLFLRYRGLARSFAAVAPFGAGSCEHLPGPQASSAALLRHPIPSHPVPQRLAPVPARSSGACFYPHDNTPVDISARWRPEPRLIWTNFPAGGDFC
jgi:hypothetical protein